MHHLDIRAKNRTINNSNIIFFKYQNGCVLLTNFYVNMDVNENYS